MIAVTDNKGTKWELIPTYPYRISRKGLVEMWCAILRVNWAKIGGLRGYTQIPVPVFTEWWS